MHTYFNVKNHAMPIITSNYKFTTNARDKDYKNTHCMYNQMLHLTPRATKVALLYAFKKAAITQGQFKL